MNISKCQFWMGVLMLGIAPVVHSAPILKCVDSTGKTTYQTQQCPETSSSSEVDIRWAAGMPTLGANITVPQARQALMSSCMSKGASQGNALLKKLATEQPAKFQGFCDCFADSALSELDKIKTLAAKNDRSGLEQLGMKAGLACAPRLR